MTIAVLFLLFAQDPEVLSSQALELVQQKRFDDAEKLWKQALTLSPRSETSFAVDSMPGLVVTVAFDGGQAASLTTVNPAGASTVYTRVAK